MGGVELTSVTCNHCGAPLEVQPGTRFLTCAHCGSRLEVHRSGGALYTEVLEAIDQRTQRIADDVDAIRRQNEVERLDREWMMRREQSLTRDKHGNASAPGSGVAMLIGSVVVAAFGVFWTVSLVNAGGPPIMALFGVIFVMVALGGGIASVVKASQYREQEARYLQDRDRATRQNERIPRD
jgi:uncharacterized Zn finger protein (UPF0148 family)